MNEFIGSKYYPEIEITEKWFSISEVFYYNLQDSKEAATKTKIHQISILFFPGPKFSKWLSLFMG